MLYADPNIINCVFPVVGITVYKSSWIIERGCLLQGQIIRGIRGQIKMLSKQSLTRLAFTVLNSEVEFDSIITLTYGETFPENGKICKRHLHKFLTYAARDFGDFEYCWFVEFQRRGAPHIHILTTLPEPDTLQRVEFALMWVRVVAAPAREEREKMFLVHAYNIRGKKAWEKIREKDGARKYALKYALKQYQKDVPESFRDVGRFWGTSRNVPPEAIKRVAVDETQLREILANLENPVGDWPILPKIVFDRT